MISRHNIKEDEVLRGYVTLLRTMLTNVYDRIRIKKSWHTKEITPNMLEGKKADLKEYGAWLKTSEAKAWFNIFGLCTELSSIKLYNTFVRTHKDSLRFIRKLNKNRNEKPQEIL